MTEDSVMDVDVGMRLVMLFYVGLNRWEMWLCCGGRRIVNFSSQKEVGGGWMLGDKDV